MENQVNYSMRGKALIIILSVLFFNLAKRFSFFQNVNKKITPPCSSQTFPNSPCETLSVLMKYAGNRIENDFAVSIFAICILQPVYSS